MGKTSKEEDLDYNRSYAPLPSTRFISGCETDTGADQRTSLIKNSSNSFQNREKSKISNLEKKGSNLYNDRKNNGGIEPFNKEGGGGNTTNSKNTLHKTRDLSLSGKKGLGSGVTE